MFRDFDNSLLQVPFVHVTYRLRSELPDPARQQRRLAELHGDVARVANGVEVRPGVQPGILFQAAASLLADRAVGVFVAEVMGRRGGAVAAEGRVGQTWKPRARYRPQP